MYRLNSINITHAFSRIAPRRHSEQQNNFAGHNSSYAAYAAIPNNNYRPNAYSPVPYQRQSVNDMRSRFTESDELNGRMGRKKAPAPQPPKPSTSYQKYPAPHPKPWEPKPRGDFSYEQKVNPIKELELIGRNHSEEVRFLLLLLFMLIDNKYK